LEAEGPVLPAATLELLARQTLVVAVVAAVAMSQLVEQVAAALSSLAMKEARAELVELSLASVVTQFTLLPLAGVW
jgi:hypothetical protein